MDEIDYEETAALIERASLTLVPAELHGQLTGLWCRYAQLPHDLGITDAQPANPAWQELLAFARSIWTRLEDPGCSYEPLLPADHAPLQERVDALVEWCDALLFGIGHAGELELDGLSEEVQEALRDLAEISRAELGAQGDEDEQAYAEIVEYVRVLAQTLYVELHPQHQDSDHMH